MGGVEAGGAELVGDGDRLGDGDVDSVTAAPDVQAHRTAVATKASP